MGTKEIQVILDDSHTVTLSSDVPDLKSLVIEIANLRDTIDVDKITVQCNSKDEFDCDGFAEVLKTSTIAFLNEIRVDDANLRLALASLSQSASSNSDTSQGNRA